MLKGRKSKILKHFIISRQFSKLFRNPHVIYHRKVLCLLFHTMNLSVLPHPSLLPKMTNFFKLSSYLSYGEIQPSLRLSQSWNSSQTFDSLGLFWLQTLHYISAIFNFFFQKLSCDIGWEKARITLSSTLSLLQAVREHSPVPKSGKWFLPVIYII